MDPDALVEEMMELARKIVYTPSNKPELVGDLAADFLELDTWLQKEGTLPRRWRRDNDH